MTWLSEYAFVSGLLLSCPLFPFKISLPYEILRYSTVGLVLRLDQCIGRPENGGEGLGGY